MNEMHTSIHDLSSGGIMVRCEQDLSYLVDEYAERIHRNVDAAALDKAAGVLAGFGYVKVVRCRDCKYMHTVRHWLGMDVDECWLHADRDSGALGKERTEPGCFCAWGEPRGDE